MENTIDSLIKFLNTASDMELLKFHTARTRKTAIRVLLTVLTIDEKKDISKIDFTSLINRYRAYEKKTHILEPLKESSLNTYITRLNSSVVDFNKWQIDPNNFQPTHTKHSKQKLKHHKVRVIDVDKISTNSSSPIYIALRETALIEIKNIPNDLTQKEVETICEILKRYSERKE